MIDGFFLFTFMIKHLLAKLFKPESLYNTLFDHSERSLGWIHHDVSYKSTRILCTQVHDAYLALQFCITIDFNRKPTLQSFLFSTCNSFITKTMDNVLVYVCNKLFFFSF